VSAFGVRENSTTETGDDGPPYADEADITMIVKLPQTLACGQNLARRLLQTGTWHPHTEYDRHKSKWSCFILKQCSLPESLSSFGKKYVCELSVCDWRAGRSTTDTAFHASWGILGFQLSFTYCNTRSCWRLQKHVEYGANYDYQHLWNSETFDILLSTFKNSSREEYWSTVQVD